MKTVIAKNIVRSYGKVKALKGVSFTLSQVKYLELLVRTEPGKLPYSGF